MRAQARIAEAQKRIQLQTRAMAEERRRWQEERRRREQEEWQQQEEKRRQEPAQSFGVGAEGVGANSTSCDVRG
jgi:tartrate dehydratase alpha subunit/fumarate hydratase class I-like protein